MFYLQPHYFLILMMLVNDTFDDRSEDPNDCKIESPHQLRGHRKSGISSKLNRPFKSPLLKTLSEQKGEKQESPSTPTLPSGTKLYIENKRSRCPFQSPASIRIQPKRMRLSTQLKKISVEDLHKKESELDQEIVQLQQEGLSIEELDHQIDLLHRYNDIKDIAQIVMGRLAELEGVTVKTLHQKYNLPLQDWSKPCSLKSWIPELWRISAHERLTHCDF